MKTLTKICAVSLVLAAESEAVDMNRLNSLSLNNFATLSQKSSIYEAQGTPHNKLLSCFNTILPRTEPKFSTLFGFKKGTNRLYSSNQENDQKQSSRYAKDYNNAPIDTYEDAHYSRENQTGQKLLEDIVESAPHEDQNPRNKQATEPTQYNLRNLLKILLKEDANFYISAGITCLFFIWCWGRISATSKKKAQDSRC